MAFEKYIRVPSVIDLKSTEKSAALRELALALCRSLKMRKYKSVISEMLKREESASTFIGQGLAIPQTRGSMKHDFAVAVGRSLRGISYDAARGARAHIVVLVMVKEEMEDSGSLIELLSEIATFFKSMEVSEPLLADEGKVDVKKFMASLTAGGAGEARGTRARKPSGDSVIGSAVQLAREIKAGALVVFTDAVKDNEFLKQIKYRGRILIVTSNKSRFNPEERPVDAIIQAPPIPASRTGQIKIGVLLALSRNLVQKNDKVVCLSGDSRVGTFDTVVILDIASEFEFFFTAAQVILPQDIKSEVFERVIGLAGEIAVEGREGKPMGTIFVLGDTNTVQAYVRQLIINPFRGYSEAERNILDPGLGETIKEFTAIDGAFIVTGDGIVLSAGSYLRPVSEIENLPSGFGSRHAAAAGITACTNAIAITISESTGMISVFKNGAIMLTIARPVVSEKSMVQKVI